MSNPTPSKLSILRAAGKVQREMAEEQAATVNLDTNVTQRRRQPAPDPASVNPLDTIAVVHDELQDVSADLRSEQDLLRRLRQGANAEPATDFEDDYVDAEDGRPNDQEEAFNIPDAPAGTSFSADWFARVIGAAVAAASSSSSAPSARSSKLKITDRKLPDFWEWQPVAWFRLFDSHVKPFKPTEAETFDALLPLLSTAACKHVQPVVRSPGSNPYSRARSSLIRHFDKTPRDHAREFRRLESLGDMMPSDMLEHILGLLPDPAIIYEVVFLDLLPPAARDAALQHTSLSVMAAAADKIVREGSSAPPAAPSNLSVSAVAAAADDLHLHEDVSPAVSAIDRRPPRQGQRRRPDARRRSPRGPRFLCDNHSCWGRDTFRCADPATCHMKDLIKPRPSGPSPPSSSSARPSGNGRAGGQ